MEKKIVYPWLKRTISCSITTVSVTIWAELSWAILLVAFSGLTHVATVCWPHLHVLWLVPHQLHGEDDWVTCFPSLRWFILLFLQEAQKHQERVRPSEQGVFTPVFYHISYSLIYQSKSQWQSQHQCAKGLYKGVDRGRHEQTGGCQCRSLPWFIS